MYFRTTSNYFAIRLYQIGFENPEALCLLGGAD